MVGDLSNDDGNVGNPSVSDSIVGHSSIDYLSVGDPSVSDSSVGAQLSATEGSKTRASVTQVSVA